MTGPIKPDQGPEPIKPRCTGHSSRTGAPCKLYPVKGSTVCHKHGASAKQVKRAAARRVALGEWSRAYGGPAADADPNEAILDEIRWTAGHLAWLRNKVAEHDEDDVAGSVWLPLYERERDRLVRQADIAIRAGIEVRMVELAEKTGALLDRLIDGLFVEIGLSEQQQVRAVAALAARRRQLIVQMN